MNIKVSKIAEGIKEYLLMIVGMSMYAFGWVECVIPAGGMGGRKAGMAADCGVLRAAVIRGVRVSVDRW